MTKIGFQVLEPEKKVKFTPIKPEVDFTPLEPETSVQTLISPRGQQQLFLPGMEELNIPADPTDVNLLDRPLVPEKSDRISQPYLGFGGMWPMQAKPPEFLDPEEFNALKQYAIEIDYRPLDFEEFNALKTAWYAGDEKEAFKAIGKDTDRRAKLYGKYFISLGGRVGTKKFLKKLNEDIEKEGEFVGLGLKTAGRLGSLALEIKIIYPLLFGAAGTVGKLGMKVKPIARALEKMKDITGLAKLAKTDPRKFMYITRALGAFGKGNVAGQTLAAIESIGKDKGFRDWILDMNKRGLLVGSLSTVFSLADTQAKYGVIDQLNAMKEQAVSAQVQRDIAASRGPEGKLVTDYEVRPGVKTKVEIPGRGPATRIRNAQQLERELSKAIYNIERELFGKHTFYKGKKIDAKKLFNDIITKGPTEQTRETLSKLPNRPKVKADELAKKTGTVTEFLAEKPTPYALSTGRTKVGPKGEILKEYKYTPKPKGVTVVERPPVVKQVAPQKAGYTSIPQEDSHKTIEGARKAAQKFADQLSKAMNVVQNPNSKAYGIQAADYPGPYKFGDVVEPVAPAKDTPSPAKEVKKPDSLDDVKGIADFIQPKIKEQFVAGKKIDNRQLKNWIAEALDVPVADLKLEKGYSHKKAQEATELAIARYAREIAQDPELSDGDKFSTLSKLYEKQPNLAVRTGDSIRRQAYSTPAPLAYLISKLGRVDDRSWVYEPTAGTGMLLIDTNHKRVLANELDPDRSKILNSQGYLTSNKDATKPVDPGVHSDYDVVLMNPPFASHEVVEFDTYKLSRLEHIVAARALDAMKDEGRAVMIIGGQKELGEYNQPNKIFGNYLYSHFNVIGDFELQGQLYARQGAAWPVRVITIAGRKKPDEELGPKSIKSRAKSWDEVYNKVQEILENEPKAERVSEVTKGPEDLGPTDRQDAERVKAPGGVSETKPKTAEELERVRKPAGDKVTPARVRREGEGGGREGAGRERGPVREAEPTERPGRGPVVKREGGEQRRAEPTKKVSERKEGKAEREAEPEPTGEEARVRGHEPTGVVSKPVLGKLQIPYKPQSKGESGFENIPTYLEPHVKEALAKLEATVGDIDQYVQVQLKYDSVEEMHKYLSASQIDSLALAIKKIDFGGAMIVGHQTGVGKGRIAAALIRREIMQGHRPIFFTAGGHLFSDMHRDFMDVGLSEDQVDPLMINADKDIKDQKNKVVFKKHGSRSKANREIEKTIEGKTDYNLVFATYSQVNKEGNKQQLLLRRLARNQLLILDESHLAAGKSNTGEYIRDNLAAEAKGVLFLSATYAKRPDTMALYARTGMLDAFDGDMASMESSIIAGGEPYQEILSATLARSHSYVRTELDFSGVDYRTDIDDDNLKRDARRADDVTDILRGIIAFDEGYSQQIVEGQKAEKKAEAKRTRGPSTTITHTNFAAVVHNAVKQMLLNLKIDATVVAAEEALKEGRKPIIVLENTMGSFLERYMTQKALDVDDEIVGFDYRSVLMSMLDGTLRYKEITPNGQETIRIIPGTGHPQYDALKERIELLGDLGLPGSPIDEIITKLEDKGYKVGEVTGRNYRIVKTLKGHKITQRSKADKDKVSQFYEFNNGDTDVLVINISGAEGVSAHASKSFKNQQQRRMIVAQPAADINKFVQLLGRVNRKGQVVDPEYRVLMTALPAEIRPAAVLEKKMRSLNANTSAKTKGAYQQKKIPDILNIYGDYIVAKYLNENTELANQLKLEEDWGDALRATQDYHGPWADVARKATGRMAVLSVEQQNEFYEAIEPEYNDLIDRLTKLGLNELISQDLDFKAKLIEGKSIYTGEPGNIWQTEATMDKMSVVRKGRPMSSKEIAIHIENMFNEMGIEIPEAENLGKSLSEAGIDYMKFMQDRIEFAFNKYVESKQGKRGFREATVKQSWIRAQQYLYRLRPGSVRTDLQTAEPYVILGIVDTYGDRKYPTNPGAPSNIRVLVAIPDPVKTLVRPLSEVGNAPTYRGQLGFETFFDVPADRREERYIANGNIIAAMGILTGEKSSSKPRVINYTMEDGSRRQGLLLPKNFDPESGLPRTVRMLPEAAAEYLRDGNRYRHIKAGDAEIGLRNETSAYMRVPKSKARGGKYFLDVSLTDIIGDFETYQNMMYAFFDPDKLEELFYYLRGRGEGLRSDDQDPDSAREYNQVHKDAKEDLGLPEEYAWRKPQVKKVKRKIPKKIEPTDKKQKPISEKKIIQHLTKAFGIPFRGVATHRAGKRLGWYSGRARGIRMRNVTSLRVASHEIGHHIDIYINNRASKNPPWGIDGELVRLGKKLYGKRKPKGGYKSEGYAEFIFGWLTGGIDLKEEAPRMLNFFNKSYLPNNPYMAEVLNTAKEMIEVWKDQGAEARFDERINRKTLKGSMNDIKNRLSLWWQTMLSDEFAILRKGLEEAGVKGDIEAAHLDPYFLAQYYTQKEGARARQMVLHYTIDLWGNRTGRGLREIMKPVAAQIKDFTRYIIAVRARQLEEREITSGFEPEDIQYIIKKYQSDKFDNIAKEVTEWNHRVMDYLVMAGGLEPKVAARMRELNPIYIPFMRAFEKGEKRLHKGIGRGVITTAKGVHGIKGSGREVIDPFESVISQTRRIIAIAHKTQIAKSLIALEEDFEGMAGLIWRVTPPQQAIKFDAEQVKKQLMQLGVEFPEAGLKDMDAMLTVYVNSPVYLGKDNIISVIVDGERRWYEVSPEMLRVLKGLDQFTLPPILNQTIGRVARGLRLGATGINAAFGLVKNPIRDSLDTIFKARHARGPIASLKGIAKDISRTGMAKALGANPSKAAQDFVAMGGQMSGFLGQDRTSTQHLRGEMLASSVGRYTLHTVRHPIDAMREIFGVPEAGPRIQEYHKALEYWMKKNNMAAGADPPPDAKVYAFLRAQDQSINYSRHGIAGKWINQMIPFWNANAQDISKVYRTFKTNGKRATLWALFGLTMPAVALWWRNKDKKWYKELPDYERANYLHIELGDDKILRLPVPFIVGHIFQGMPVAVLNSLYRSDPQAVKDMFGQIFMQDIFPLTGWYFFDQFAAISPLIDVAQNKDWAGRPIVPQKFENKLAEDRYKSYTTKFAIVLGRIFKVSPLQIEYVMNAWSGGLYRRVGRGAELAVGVAEIKQPADYPVIGTLFVRDSYAPKAKIEKFYKRRDLLNQKYGSDKITNDEKIDRAIHNKISRGLSSYWTQLEKAKTVKERKKIYSKIDALIDFAEQK